MIKHVDAQPLVMPSQARHSLRPKQEQSAFRDQELPMLYVDIPSRPEIEKLAASRAEPSVTIYVKTTPLTQEIGASRIALKNLEHQALEQLKAAGVDKRRLWPIEEVINHLVDDDAFWAIAGQQPGALRHARRPADLPARQSHSRSGACVGPLPHPAAAACRHLPAQRLHSGTRRERREALSARRRQRARSRCACRICPRMPATRWARPR